MEATRTTAAGPSAAGSQIRTIAEADVAAVADVLACAFYDDPLIGGWAVPDEARRLKALRGGFGLYTRRLWLRHGACLTTDDVAGAAMWLPPGTGLRQPSTGWAGGACSAGTWEPS